MHITFARCGPIRPVITSTASLADNGLANPVTESDMNVERSWHLVPLLDALEIDKPGYHAIRHFNVSLMDALRVPLKTIQERNRSCAHQKLHLARGMVKHSTGLQTKTRPRDQAKRLPKPLQGRVQTTVELNSGRLSAHQNENFQAGKLGSQ